MFLLVTCQRQRFRVLPSPTPAPPANTYHNHATHLGMLHIETTQQRRRGAKPAVQLQSVCQREAANFRDVDTSAVSATGTPK